MSDGVEGLADGLQRILDARDSEPEPTIAEVAANLAETLRQAVAELELEGHPADSPEGRLLVGLRSAVAEWDAGATVGSPCGATIGGGGVACGLEPGHEGGHRFGTVSWNYDARLRRL